MSDIGQHWNPGVRAHAVVDFSDVGTAGKDILINGVSYLEADTADATIGVWTNGASAANSATSFAAAINGDTRRNAPKVSAVVSDAGDSVIIVADEPGSAYEYTVALGTGMLTATVENMSRSQKDGRKMLWTVNHTTTAQDVLADEINIPVPYTPDGWQVFWRAATGAPLATQPTATISLETSPTRLRINFAGATDPSAGQIASVLMWKDA